MGKITNQTASARVLVRIESKCNRDIYDSRVQLCSRAATHKGDSLKCEHIQPTRIGTIYK